MNGQKQLHLEQLEPRVVLSGTNWADTFGSTKSEIAYDVEAGPDGSAYVTGSFRDGTTIDFDDQSDGGEITSTLNGSEKFAKSDAFLVKYDHIGGFEWAIHAANLDHASISNVSLDSQGNAYIVGSFEADLALKRDGAVQAAVSDTGSGSGRDLFIAKISSSGNVEWLQAMGGQGNPWLDIVEVLEDPSTGQVELIVSGHSWGSSDLDPGPGDTLQDALHDHKYGFLAKYVFDDTADSLALVWLQTHHLGTEIGSLWIRETDVSANQVVGVGSSSSTASYIGIFDAATGAVLEENEASSAAPRGGVDRLGDDLFVSGIFTGSVDLDGDGTVDLVGDATTRGYIANFVYDPTSAAGEQLSVAWATMLTGTGNNAIADVKLSPGGVLYGTGRFSDSISADGIELQSRGSMDAHIVALDPHSGGLLWAESLGGSGYDEPRMLQVDANGTLYVVGNTSSTDATFPNVPGTFASAGSDDGFIAVFTPVSSDPPVTDAGPDQVGTEDQSITFDASASSDPDGDPLTYVWDFGDGQTLQTTSPIAGHTYAYGGEFAVVLTVLDANGNSDSDQATVTIGEVNDAPVAEPGGPYSGFTATPITLDASGSSDFDNIDGTTANDETLTYTWDFGDGGTISTLTPTVEHTYAAAGEYTVSLTVSDGTATSVLAATTAVIDVAPAGDPNTIYVWDILDTLETRKRGKNFTDYRLVIDVRQDSDGDGVAEVTDAAIAGVAVTVELKNAGGNLIGTYSGLTNDQGLFQTDWIKGLQPGDYRAEVVDLALAGFSWDPFDVLDATENDEDEDGDGLPDELFSIL